MKSELDHCTSIAQGQSPSLIRIIALLSLDSLGLELSPYEPRSEKTGLRGF